MAAKNPLDLPEIRELLVPFLTADDLTHCSRMWNFFSRLVSLELRNTWISEPPGSITASWKIKDLSLELVSGLTSVEQLRWIENCPQLKRLTWIPSKILTSNLTEEIAQSAAANTWPDLEEFYAPNFMASNRQVSLVISGMRRVHGLSINSRKPLDLIRPILRPQVTWLKRLEVITISGNNSLFALEILKSCPRLESLRMGTVHVRDMLDDETPWACESSLRRLKVCFEVDQDISEAGQRILLERLSRLYNLELLDLSCEKRVVYSLDLRLESGLEQLATLIRLEELALFRTEAQPCGDIDCKVTIKADNITKRCQEWHTSFLPYLWKAIDLPTASNKQPSLELLQEHKNYVRCLVYQGRVPDDHLSTRLPALKKLHLLSATTEDAELVRNHPSLTHLKLHSASYNKPEWIPPACLLNLVNLSLIEVDVRSQDRDTVWCLFSRLETLELRESKLPELPESMSTSWRMKGLILGRVGGLTSEEQLRWIEHCIHLKRLSWVPPRGFTGNSDERFIQSLITNTWPDLSEFYSPWLEASERQASLIIGGMRRVHCLSISYTEPLDTVKTALRPHFSWLMKLESSAISGNNSLFIIELLKSCPQLESLRMGMVQVRDMLDDDVPWACESSLRHLAACFNIEDDIREAGQRSSSSGQDTNISGTIDPVMVVLGATTNFGMKEK
ncbi:MAG: hypothetical protein J3Q66DRAFT_391397 [Benniella sp.]|nr:MAG: hypothetical protein J3Q66DRAFT_391397 [Benniella sp.]